MNTKAAPPVHKSRTSPERRPEHHPAHQLALRLRALGLCLLCALCLSACLGGKDSGFDDGLALNMDDSAVLASYRLALQDDGIPLSDEEMRAFISTGELDKGLSKDELRIVQVYYKHYLHAGRPVIERFLQRSEPYIDFTRQVFRERGLPEELANLAYVESGYNPLAVSRSRAVGMWQFMAATGRQYGLRQDWWMDERRDPYRATHAAADYLSKLYGDFKNWHLAIAAYNAGEGKIGRALAGTGSSGFFELCANNHLLDESAQLREETQQYLPRFLAFTKIMRHAQALGFEPAPPPEDKPSITRAVALTARPGTDLAALAKHLDMRWEEFAAYNPAFTRYITPPDRHVAVYVPHYAEAFAEQLLRDDKLVPAGLSVYVVVRGDTLGRISSRTGVPVRVLRSMNPRCEPLRIGARLNLPGRAGSDPSGGVTTAQTTRPAPAVRSAAPATRSAQRAAAQTPAAPAVRQAQSDARAASAAAPAKPAAQPAAQLSVRHTVKAGETLASIGRTYDVSLTAMRQANGDLQNPNALRPGQTVHIPLHVATYRVQPGDTMWAIARKFNMPPRDLLALNNMKSGQVLRPGDTVRVTRN